MDHSIIVPILSEVTVSLILFVGGYLIGKYRERKSLMGKNLEEYDFYPFEVDRTIFPNLILKISD